MSLDFNLTKIADPDQLRDGEGNLGAVTSALIWATIPVGIGEITDKTAEEFYVRLEIVQRLHGGYIFEDGQSRNITLAEVRRHIGLKTNVFPAESKAQFHNKMMRGLRSDAEARLRAAILEAQERTEKEGTDG